MRPALCLLALLLAADAGATQNAKLVLNLNDSPGFKAAVETLLVKTRVGVLADRCGSTVEVNYEGLKEHRITSEERSGPSLSTGKIDRMEVELDPASAPNKRQLEFYEHCKYTEVTTTSCSDGKGGTTTCTQEDDDYLDLGWTCDFPGIAEVGKTQKLQCKLDAPRIQSRFRRRGLNQDLVKKVAAENQFELAVETKAVEKKASDTVVKVNGGRKVWVRLLEGVTGHDGENDFEYMIDLDGERLTAKVPDGQLNYDIEYHTNAKSVHVGVSAVERDLIFDDHYVPQNSLDLTTKAPGNTGKITLKRSTWFGEWFTYKDHQVTVIVSEDDPSSLDLSTAALLAIEVTKRAAMKDWGKAIQGTTRAVKDGEKYNPEPVDSGGSSGSWDAK